MLKRLFNLILSFVFLTVSFPGLGRISFAQTHPDEKVLLSAYYPSPSGDYDTIKVKNQATISILALDSMPDPPYLGTWGENTHTITPIIDQNGTLKIPQSMPLHITGTYNTRILASKYLTLPPGFRDPSNRSWGPVYWQQGPYIPNPPEDCTLFSGGIVSQPQGCDNGYVNSIQTLSYIWPICWAFPLGIGSLWAAICIGQEQYRMWHSCIDPYSY